MEPFDLREWEGFEEAGGNRFFPAMIDQVAIDTKRIHSSRSLFVALKGARVDAHQYLFHASVKGAAYALIERECPPCLIPQNLKLLRVADPLNALQEIAKAYRRRLHCKVVAIAGSYGKTMVKDLLFALLAQDRKVKASPESFNSQIGVPLSLFTLSKDDDLAIIEAGISKMGEMARLQEMLAPDHAILTHVGRKHLQTLGSLAKTTEEMYLLLQNIPPENWTIVPQSAGSSPQKAVFWNCNRKDLPFARKMPKGNNSSDNYSVHFPDGHRFEGRILSGHNYFLDLMNMTIKAAWLLGGRTEQITQVLSLYTPEPMRTEIWDSPTGETIINEPYCADPQSVDLALNHFSRSHPKGKKMFIFGGMLRQDAHLEKDYARIGEAIAEAGTDTLVLIGNHPYRLLIDTVQARSTKTIIKRRENFEQAIQEIKSEVKPHDTVLIMGERKQPQNKVDTLFQGSVSTNRCFIKLAAIATNLNMIRKKIGEKTRLMPIVKAFAYGTNPMLMAKFLERQGVDILGVSYVDEGVALKKAGVKVSIFAINAALYEAKKAVEWGLEIGVSDLSLAKALADEAARKEKTVHVHLHVDTGMSRLGCRPQEACELAQWISHCPGLKLEGIMTHFACAENASEDPFTEGQIQQFDRVITEIERQGIDIPWKHAANSSAAARFCLPQYNMARIGLALYGLSSSNAVKKTLELKPVLTLQSRIAGIHLCKKGETISYGRHYTVAEETQAIAVLPIGYFDGLHRHFSGKGHVMIHGQKAPMVGAICMDYLMVDISAIPNAAVGDPVLIFGEDDDGNHLPSEVLATQGNSIIHELIACLGPRIQRVFIYEEDASSH